jgi:hypothetical protein
VLSRTGAEAAAEAQAAAAARTGHPPAALDTSLTVGSGAPWGALPRQRHSSDLLRIVLGAVVVLSSAWLALRAVPTAFEVNSFRLINDFPAYLGPPLLGAMQLGALGAVPLLALLALLGRRARLAPLLLAAGGASWAAARIIQMLVDEDPPTVHIAHVVLRGAPVWPPSPATI